MNFEIFTLPIFDKQVKRLVKKYPSLKTDLTDLALELSTNPRKGIDLGNHFYKIRLPIASKGRGKSGGARVITFLKIRKQVVYLASIFDKSEKESLSDAELRELFKHITED